MSPNLFATIPNNFTRAIPELGFASVAVYGVLAAEAAPGVLMQGKNRSYSELEVVPIESKENESVNCISLMHSVVHVYETLSGKSEPTHVAVKIQNEVIFKALESGDKGRSLATYCVLAMYSDKDGRCRKPLAKIAEKIGKSKRTVSGYLRTLEDLGLIRWNAAGVMK